MIFLAQLPHKISEPLHIIETDFSGSWKNFILLPILLGILWWLYKYFMEKQKLIPQKRKRLFNTVDVNGVLEDLVKIQKNHAANFTYRDGLHELSRLMRYYFEQKTGLDVEEMTFEEIESAIKEHKIINLFKELTILQFQRREPMASEYKETFDFAKAILTENKKIKQNPQPIQNQKQLKPEAQGTIEIVRPVRK